MNALLKRVLTIALSTALLISTLTFGGANVVLAQGYKETEIKATETYNDTIEITQATLSEVNGVYSVGSEADWTALVNKGSDYAGKTVVLTDNITFANANATLTTFAGKLDGNGYTLKGVTNPLIGTLNGGATIQNLIIENANVVEPTIEKLGLIANVINVTADIALTNIAVKNATVSNVTSAIDNDGTCAGGMLGRVDAGTATISLTNCTVSGSVAGKQYTGGFIGITSTTSVTLVMNNCKNSASIGISDAPAYNMYVGGFVGYNKLKSTTVTNCENAGDLTVADAVFASNQYAYVGSVFGRIRGNGYTIENFCNTGDISVKAKGGAAYIGGLVGHMDTGVASLTSCVNYGDVATAATSTVPDYVGGFIGQCNKETTITNCVNYGAISSGNVATKGTSGAIFGSVGGFVGILGAGALTISASYNVGAVSSADAYAAGFVAQTQLPVTLNGCVNVADISTKAENGSAIHVAAGMMAATVHANAKNSAITNCINTGNVSGYGAAAGILGSNTLNTTTGVTVSGCSNSGNVTSAQNAGGIIANTLAAVSVSGCYATGAYVGTTAGAIAGVATNVTVADSYASVTLNDVYTAWEGAAKSEKTEADMISALAVLNLEAQKSAVADGKFDVVALAGMNKLSYLTQVGFEIIRVVDGKIATLSTEGTNVYTDVYGYDADGNKVKVNATDYENVKYLSALKITNVSTEENVTYLYRAFAVKTVEGVETTLYGTWSAVTFAPVAE